METDLTDRRPEDDEYRSRVVLHFPPELVEQPVVYNLVKRYELAFNILRADVDRNKEGLLVLELSGDRSRFQDGMAFLRKEGIGVQPLSQDVVRIEERCTHCGACIAICPSGALHLNGGDREVSFEQEKCIACDLCLKGCPVRAMEISY